MKTLYGNYQKPKFHALELGAKKNQAIFLLTRWS